MSKAFEIVNLQPVETFCVEAEGGPETYPDTFRRLEEIVPLKGHRFYGVYERENKTYRACVCPVEGDDTDSWRLDSYIIPGGKYAYRKIQGEHDELITQVPGAFEELEAEYEADPERPSIEFYRRFDEFRLYLPIKNSE